MLLSNRVPGRQNPYHFPKDRLSARKRVEAKVDDDFIGAVANDNAPFVTDPAAHIPTYVRAMFSHVRLSVVNVDLAGGSRRRREPPAWRKRDQRAALSFLAAKRRPERPERKTVPAATLCRRRHRHQSGDLTRNEKGPAKRLGSSLA